METLLFILDHWLQDPLFKMLSQSLTDEQLSPYLCILLLYWIHNDPPHKQARQLALIQAYHESCTTFKLDLLQHLLDVPTQQQALVHTIAPLQSHQRLLLIELYLWCISFLYIISEDQVMEHYMQVHIYASDQSIQPSGSALDLNLSFDQVLMTLEYKPNHHWQTFMHHALYFSQQVDHHTTKQLRSVHTTHEANKTLTTIYTHIHSHHSSSQTYPLDMIQITRFLYQANSMQSRMNYILKSIRKNILK